MPGQAITAVAAVRLALRLFGRTGGRAGHALVGEPCQGAGARRFSRSSTEHNGDMLAASFLPPPVMSGRPNP